VKTGVKELGDSVIRLKPRNTSETDPSKGGGSQIRGGKKEGQGKTSVTKKPDKTKASKMALPSFVPEGGGRPAFEFALRRKGCEVTVET